MAMTGEVVLVRWFVYCGECGHEYTHEREVSQGIRFAPPNPRECPECGTEFTEHNHSKTYTVGGIIDD